MNSRKCASRWRRPALSCALCSLTVMVVCGQGAPPAPASPAIDSKQYELLAAADSNNSPDRAIVAKNNVLAESAAAAPAPAAPAALSLALAPTPLRHFSIPLLSHPFVMKYTRKGLQIETGDGRYTARIQWRIQTRYATPFSSDPRKPGDFSASDPDHFGIHRARFKLSGKAFGGLVTYAYEHNLLEPQPINMYADLNLKPWIHIRGGQWKSVFSQERYISSGKQQFVDRSIVNREFTADRQSGVSVYGHLLPDTLGDSWYYFELLTGAGLNAGGDGDGRPMYVARYQWDFLGREPDEASSDIENHRQPAAYVAFSALSDRSRYTRFSSSGGGELDGFTLGTPGQYDLRQFNAEFMLKYRGLSIQNENHWKRVDDRLTGVRTNLRGSYAQAGYFPHAAWRSFPSRVEVAYRYAYVDGRVGVPGDLRQENSIVLNVFFEGHDDKFSAEIGRLFLAQIGLPDLAANRYRLQWDVHF